MPTESIQTEPIPATAPRPVAPASARADDLAGVIAYVEAQLRSLSDLCGDAPQARPAGLVPEELQRQRDALARAAQSIADREAELQAWHDKLQSTQQRLATEHETVTGTLEQRRAELNSRDGTIRVRDAEVSSRRESLAAREASLTAAEGEVAARERRFAATRQSLDRRNAELDAASARLEERAARLGERAEAVRLAESQADARASVITEQQVSLDDRAAAHQADTAEADALRATIASLQANLQEAQARAAEPPPAAPVAEPESNQELDRVSRQRDALARELSDRERLVEQLSADCLVLRADADAALTRGAEQDRQIRRLEGRIAEALAEASGQTGQMETQRSLLRAARSEATSAHHRLESFRAELDIRHEELTERAHELDLREADLERRDAALESAPARPAPGRRARPDMPGVTSVPAPGLTVPAAWFAWEAPRRRRPGADRSDSPSNRR